MRKYPAATFMASFLCLLALLPIILRIFGLEGSEGMLPALAVLVMDSSGFLTVLCIIAAVICLAKRIGFLLAFYLADAVLVNQLYLNDRWPVYLNLMGTVLNALKGPNVLTGLFFAALVLLGIWAFWKRSPSYRNGFGKVFEEKTLGSAKGETPASPEETTQNPEHGQAVTNESNMESQLNEPQKGFGFSVSGLCMGLFLGGISVFVVNLLLQRTMGLEPPPGLEWLFQQLYPLALICVGGLVCILTARSLSGNWKVEGGMRGTALFSLVTEAVIIVVVVYHGGNLELHVLNNVLSLISSNELIALIVSPVLLFILLDMMFCIVLSIISKKNGPSWINDSKGKLVAIEKGLSDLVLNLIIGFMNLLLFIPDFFNQLGALLLDKNSLFPYNQIPTKLEESDEQGSKRSPENQGSSGSPSAGSEPDEPLGVQGEEDAP